MLEVSSTITHRGSAGTLRIPTCYSRLRLSFQVCSRSTHQPPTGAGFGRAPHPRGQKTSPRSRVLARAAALQTRLTRLPLYRWPQDGARSMGDARLGATPAVCARKRMLGRKICGTISGSHTSPRTPQRISARRVARASARSRIYACISGQVAASPGEGDRTLHLGSPAQLM